MCCLTILEARSPKLRCQQGQALTDGSQEEFFLTSSSFWCLPKILGIPWLADVSVQSHDHLLLGSSHHLPSMHVCLCVPIFPFHKDISRIGLGPALMTSFDLIISVKPQFQTRSHSEILRIETSTYLL